MAGFVAATWPAATSSTCRPRCRHGRRSRGAANRYQHTVGKTGRPFTRPTHHRRHARWQPALCQTCVQPPKRQWSPTQTGTVESQTRPLGSGWLRPMRSLMAHKCPERPFSMTRGPRNHRPRAIERQRSHGAMTRWPSAAASPRARALSAPGADGRASRRTLRPRWATHLRSSSLEELDSHHGLGQEGALRHPALRAARRHRMYRAPRSGKPNELVAPARAITDGMSLTVLIASPAQAK